jgi:cellulose synthase operon protein C
MLTLRFPDEQTFRLVLSSGVVPEEISHGQARGCIDSEGRPFVILDKPLTSDVLARLNRLGVQVLDTDLQPLPELLRCWAELLPLSPSSETSGSRTGPVLFGVPAHSLAALVGELRRLGGYAPQLRWVSDPGEELDEGEELLALLLIDSPPWFTLSRVLEPGSSLRAYRHQADRVWTALGWEHPIADQLIVPTGKLLLLRPPRDYRTIADGPYGEEPGWFNLHVPSGVLQVSNDSTKGRTSPPSRLPVHLRLTRTHERLSPELWIFPAQAREHLRILARSLTSNTLARLSFTIAHQDGKECLLLRANSGKEPPPVLVERAFGFVSMVQLPNLFVPTGWRLAPMPRRDALRELLATRPDRLTWLWPTRQGSFIPGSVPLAAFRSLGDWVEYVADTPIELHSGWSESGNVFRFEPYAIQPDAEAKSSLAGSVARRGQPAQTQLGEGSPGWLGRVVGWAKGWIKGSDQPATRSPESDILAIPAEEAVQNTNRPARDRLNRLESTRSGVAQEQCNKLEARFLETLTGKGDLDRASLWAELASTYEQLGHHSDAALCWLHVLWTYPENSPAWAHAWLRAEAKTARVNLQSFDPGQYLDRSLTDPAMARTLAALVVHAAAQNAPPESLIGHLSGLQRVLEAHESALPLRAAWLARTALARLSGGDVLGLARTRDRLLERLLHNGLSLELDTPTFLRYASSGASDRLQTVRRWLFDRRELIRSWVTEMGGGIRTESGLQRFGLEVETANTQGYIDLILAWGSTRFGEHQASARLRKNALAVLARNEPVHELLREAFEHRIQQAERGSAPRGPLPNDLLTRLESLDSDARYRVEKLLEHSRILAPIERFDAYDLVFSADQRVSGPERLAYSLGGVTDPTELVARIEQVLGSLSALNPPTRLKVMRRLIGNAPRAGEVLVARALREALTLLETEMLPLADQASLIEAGLFAAGHFDNGEMVRRLAALLVRLFERPGHANDFDKLPEPMEQAVRALRRLGLRTESDLILQRVAEKVLQGQSFAAARSRLKKSGAWVAALRALLGVASGWYYAGKSDPAHAVIDQAGKDLYGTALTRMERTQLALTYARTLGSVSPVRVALGRFEELFQRLKDLRLASTTDSHYNLNILRLVEIMVRAVVAEDFTLGPAVRGWLDDEEYLVRQRIHRDMKALLAQHGV